MKKKEINILNIMLGNGLGGLEDMGINYANEIKNSDLKCISVFSKKSKLMHKMKNIANVNFVNCRNKFDILCAFKIAKLIKKNNITHIFLHGHKVLSVVLISLWFLKTKLQLIFVDHTEKSMKNLEKTDKIIAINNQNYEKLHKIPSLQQKVEFIQNFVDMKRYNNFLTKELKGNELTVGWCHRHHPRKRLDLFLDAMKILQNQGLNINIVLAGVKEDECPELLDGVKNVNCMGWLDNVDDFYKKIDIFCISSMNEPFGLTVLYSLACGIPVVATPTQGPSYIISQVKNSSIIAKDFTAQDLSDCFAKFYNMSIDEKQKMTENAKKLADLYDTRHWIKKIRDLLN